jgi:hypothetical protein
VGWLRGKEARRLESGLSQKLKADFIPQKRVFCCPRLSKISQDGASLKLYGKTKLSHHLLLEPILPEEGDFRPLLPAWASGHWKASPGMGGHLCSHRLLSNIHPYVFESEMRAMKFIPLLSVCLPLPASLWHSDEFIVEKSSGRESSVANWCYSLKLSWGWLPSTSGDEGLWGSLT